MLKGFDEERIARHERRAGFAFPAQFRELLLAVGLEAPGFFTGTDIFMIDLTDDANVLLSDYDEVLPQGAWVFSMHQGYQFDWFENGMGDDPPVHKWIEGQPMRLNAWPSLSGWLHDAIGWHLQFKK